MFPGLPARPNCFRGVCAVDPRLAQCEAPTGGEMKLQLPDDCPSAYLFASPRYLTDLNPALRLTSQAFEHRSDPLAATNAHRHGVVE